jgi:hypothetical protein
VTPSKQAELARAREEIAKLGLSPAQASAGLQLLQNSPPLPLTVWFDSHQLMRQMSVAFQLGGLAGGQLVMTITRYGAPVRITAPAPSDTISFQEFLKTAGQLGGS